VVAVCLGKNALFLLGWKVPRRLLALSSVHILCYLPSPLLQSLATLAYIWNEEKGVSFRQCVQYTVLHAENCVEFLVCAYIV
jgi:hypothetical protein